MKVIHQILRPCRLWSVPEIWVFGLQHQLAHTFFVALDRHISKLQFESRFGKIMLEFCFRAYLFGFAVKEWWSKMKEESNFCIVRIHASIWSSLLFHCEFIWAVFNVSPRTNQSEKHSVSSIWNLTCFGLFNNLLPYEFVYFILFVQNVYADKKVFKKKD